jgi:hypothetical protein
MQNLSMLFNLDFVIYKQKNKIVQQEVVIYAGARRYLCTLNQKQVYGIRTGAPDKSNTHGRKKKVKVVVI